MSRPTRFRHLFVAAFAPADAVREWQTPARETAPAACRWTPELECYLTVHFIGDVPARDVERLVESCERSTAGLSAFEVRPLRIVARPADGLTRSLAVVTDAPPALLEIKSRLVQRLGKAGRRSDIARFEPHFTIARFAAPTDTAFTPLPCDGSPIAVRRLVLVRTVLRPAATSHPVVAEFVLRS